MVHTEVIKHRDMDEPERKIKKRLSSKNKQLDRRISERTKSRKRLSLARDPPKRNGKQTNRNLMDGPTKVHKEKDRYECNTSINISIIDNELCDNQNMPRISPSRVMDQEEEEELDKLRLERMQSGQRRGAFYAANTSYLNKFDDENIPEAPNPCSGLIMLNRHLLKDNIKHKVRSKSKKIHCGIAETIGRRQSMEDNFIFIGSLKGKRFQDFFGIFDGHRGVTASQFVVDEIEQVLCKTMKKYKEHTEMLKETFKYVNRLMRKRKVSSGTTVIACYRYRDTCYVVNIGDSRAVLCDNGQALRVTQDHKPDRLDELDRITSLGGEVTNYVSKDGKVISRVQGVLSVSRALGDFDLVPYVIGEPEIYKIELSKDNENRLLIMACDGLWEVVSDQEAVDIVNEMVKKYDVEKAASKLRDIAYSRGSTDNITVMVVRFLNRYDIETED